MSDGVCMFCGPDIPLSAKPEQRAVAAGWKGFDRDLGANKREERARAAAEARKREEPRPERSWIGWTVAFVISLGVAGGLWQSGILAKPAQNMAPRAGEELKSAPSAARPDLLLYAHQLQELAVDCDHKLVGKDDPAPGDVDRLQDQLGRLHDVGRTLEPQLTRDETRILSQLQQGELHLKRFLKSFKGPAPDLLGVETQAATAQFNSALTVARGDSAVASANEYVKKASSAEEMQKVLDQH
jgi:hypothetical protein